MDLDHQVESHCASEPTLGPAHQRLVGRVATLAGGGGKGQMDGPPCDARFCYPHSVAHAILAGSRCLVVADFDNNSIRRVLSIPPFFCLTPFEVFFLPLPSSVPLMCSLTPIPFDAFVSPILPPFSITFPLSFFSNPLPRSFDTNYIRG